MCSWDMHDSTVLPTSLLYSYHIVIVFGKLLAQQELPRSNMSDVNKSASVLMASYMRRCFRGKSMPRGGKMHTAVESQGEEFVNFKRFKDGRVSVFGYW